MHIFLKSKSLFFGEKDHSDSEWAGTSLFYRKKEKKNSAAVSPSMIFIFVHFLFYHKYIGT